MHILCKGTSNFWRTPIHGFSIISRDLDRYITNEQNRIEGVGVVKKEEEMLLFNGPYFFIHNLRMDTSPSPKHEVENSPSAK